jgi:V/A-type H+-transporting ATPase subunit I
MFGIFLSMLNRFREQGIKYGIQPISYLIMIMSVLVIAAHKDIMGVASVTVGNLNIGEIILKIPEKASKFMLLSGLLLLMFFNNVDKKIWIRPPMALWELYNFISGLVGDILSYLRLFALGLAGGLLGGAFNNIAFMVMKDTSGVYSVGGIIGGVLIMVLGHSLNIVLAIMGAFVHSLRLTFVEFYKNLQFAGGGKPFTPFGLEK